MPVAEALFCRTLIGNDCWEWTGTCSTTGYARLNVREKNGSAVKKTTKQAHRLWYELMREPIGDLVLDHLCHNRSCVNPWHMEPVTRSENSQAARRQRHCPTCECTGLRKGR